MGDFGGQAFGGKGRQSRAERRESAAGSQAADAAQELARIAHALFGQTAGLRGQTVNILERVLAGERPSQMRVFAPEREAIEGQFGQARQALLGTSGARGGQLTSALANLDIARAQGVSGLESDVRRQAFNQALSTGFGAPPVSIAGLTGAGSVFGTAGNIFGQAATRAQADVQAKNESIGKIAALAAGAAFV